MLVNLKSANFGGVKSEGMVLTSKLKDNSICLLGFDNQNSPAVGSLVGPKDWILNKSKQNVDFKNDWSVLEFVSDAPGDTFFRVYKEKQETKNKKNKSGKKKPLSQTQPPNSTISQNNTQDDQPKLVQLFAYSGKKTHKVVVVPKENSSSDLTGNIC